MEASEEGEEGNFECWMLIEGMNVICPLWCIVLCASFIKGLDFFSAIKLK
jgi:hypothetical protein